MPTPSNRTILARSIRAEALMLLGGRCLLCSGQTDLQFHVLFNDYGAHHHFGSVKRARFYLACAKAGDAVLLCRACHARQHTLAPRYYSKSAAARRQLRGVTAHDFLSVNKHPKHGSASSDYGDLDVPF